MTTRPLPGLLAAAALSGCAAGQLLTVSPQKVADAMQRQDLVYLADICTDTGRGLLGGTGDTSDKNRQLACASWYEIQARQLEARVTAGDAAAAKDVCSRKTVLDKHPGTGATNFPRVPTEQMEGRVGPAMRLALKAKAPKEIDSQVLACALEDHTAAQETALATQADTVDVAQVKALALTAGAVCPGSSTEIAVELTLADGTTKKTWTDASRKRGFVDPSMFTFTSAQGEVSGRRFTLTPVLPRVLDGVVLKVALAAKPEVAIEKPLTLDFGCQKGLVFGAESGRHGAAGKAGSGYRDNSTTSKPADGEAGGPGAAGSAGGNGGAVTVDVALVQGKAAGKLLLAKATDGKQTAWFGRPAEQVTKLSISAPGGDGGDGGNGGEGGMGQGSSGQASPNPGGKGGDAGNGGSGGDGGAGGTLKVRYDKAHPELAKLIDASAPGGRAGRAGSAGAPGDGGPADNGARGAKGRAGVDGKAGTPGKNGPAPQLQAVPAAQLFAGDGMKPL